MKIALLFSGKLGAWEECLTSVTENIIWPLKPDIFVSTWEDEPSYDFCNYYKPVKRQILNFEETMKLLKPINKLPCQPSKGLLPMLANMKAVYKLLKNQKTKYDLIIRLRPDIQVLEQIKKHEIQDCIKSNCIRLPLFESVNIYNHEEELKKEFAFSFVNDQAALPDQINDQIAIGAPDQMDKYMTCLDDYVNAINMLWNEGYPEYMIKVPESVLTITLKLKNCKYKQLTGSNRFGNIKTKLIK